MSGTAASFGAFAAQVQSFVLVDPVDSVVIVYKSLASQQDKYSIKSVSNAGLCDVPDTQTKSGFTAFMRLVVERGGAQYDAYISSP